LRNMEPMVQIAKRMEELCPNAVLINFTNPESKLCQAVTILSKIRTFGLCHGAMDGMKQIASILQMPVEEIDAKACGMNHFSWFQTIHSKKTGEDLYPRLREQEKLAEPLAHWDEMALNRICLRVFGLYPSPGVNHIGEYIRWAHEFLASSSLQYYYDPTEGHPWETGKIPRFIYSLSERFTEVPLFSSRKSAQSTSSDDTNMVNKQALIPSGELAVPIIEAIACGTKHELYAVNVPNNGAIPGLDGDIVVEVPAIADGKEVRFQQMTRLPEAITAMLRLQASIQKLVVEAYIEKSRRKLLQAILLDPTVHSYRNAVALINEMCELQKDVLPQLEW
jgi:alpha-galactosidase